MIFLQPTCPLGDWPGEAQAHGLVVVEKRVRTDYERARLVVEFILAPVTAGGEPVRILRMGEPLPEQLPQSSPQPPAGQKEAQNAPWRFPVTLRDTIAGLIDRAAAQPGRPQRAFLRGGLRIDLLLKDGQTHLQISRAGVDPSVTEWNVTLANFPYTVPLVQDKALSRQGRFYRAASWPTPGLAEATPKRSEERNERETGKSI